MIAWAAAGRSPIGAGLGGPVPGPVGAAELDGAELDSAPTVVESTVADMHTARTPTATKGRPRTRWLLIIRRTMALPLLFGALGGLVGVIEITFYSTDHEAGTEVALLIAGPGVYICNGCVALCNDIIDEELAPTPTVLAGIGPSTIGAERAPASSPSAPPFAANSRQSRWRTVARSRRICPEQGLRSGPPGSRTLHLGIEKSPALPDELAARGKRCGPS